MELVSPGRPAPGPSDLASVVRARFASAPPSVVGANPLARLRADVVLDAGAEGAVTIVIWNGRVSAHPGRTEAPVTRVEGSLADLVAIVQGRRSGVEAFLAGDIAVSGNLALSLQLDGLFRPEGQVGGRCLAAGLVDVAGVRTSFVEAGPPDAPTVVALHGLGATNASMLPCVWDLATDYHVLAPDLPGHGASSAPIAAYDAAFFARWLAGLLEARGTRSAVLVGNSLGGRISLEVALVRPDLVDALVLLAPAVAFRRLRQFVPLVRLLRPELAALPLPVTQRMAARGLRLLFARPERLTPTAYAAAAGEFVRVFRDMRHRIAFHAALRQIYLDDAFGAEGFWRRLPALEAPALFVWGDRDRLVPAGFARHVTAAVPGSSTVVLEDCGHVPQFELPDRTNAEIRAFLSSVGLSPAGDGEMSGKGPAAQAAEPSGGSASVG